MFTGIVTDIGEVIAVRPRAEGLHRLEAAKWLGETEIDAYLVQARRH